MRKKLDRSKNLVWTTELTDRLCKLIEAGRTYFEIAELMSLRYEQVKGKGLQLGYRTSGKRRWSREEDDLIINNCATMDIKQVQALIPNRSINAIRERAYKHLNVTFKTMGKQPWTKNDIDVFIEIAPFKTNTELAEIFDRTVYAIKQKASDLGVRTKRDDQPCSIVIMPQYESGKRDLNYHNTVLSELRCNLTPIQKLALLSIW